MIAGVAVAYARPCAGASPDAAQAMGAGARALANEIASAFADLQIAFTWGAGFSLLAIGACALSGRMNWGWLWQVGMAVFFLCVSGVLVGELVGTSGDVIGDAITDQAQSDKLLRFKHPDPEPEDPDP